MPQKPAADTTTARPEDEKAQVLFPVVGVGASAGGLAATAELLGHLGSKPNIAIIIVQHLDPNHESNLVHILARSTPLPVHKVSDGMRVAPNHVYVVPSNADMLMAAGRLGLTPRSDRAGLHLPIDRFFESLAQDCTVHAVGVVLSGTGSDGTAGIQAIKAAGGITLAQDASAEFRNMPESAVATGRVDFILPLERIAAELVRIGTQDPASESIADDTVYFRRILSAMVRESGIDFINYKHSTLRRRVQRRVVVNNLPSLREYAELVERSRDEARILCDEVLIHVTSFFRDPEVFEALKTTVFPKLLENRTQDACIRIWVPGCSSGEEVYSLAIGLLEFLAEHHASQIPIKLFGTDVSAGAIGKARAAKYPATILQDVSPERLQRFFLKNDDVYQVRKDIRDLCIFAKQDATRDPPFAGMDLISCRNLMIYLGSALQARVLPTFHYALKESGVLVLGSAETIRAFPGFVALDDKSRIYVRRPAVRRPLLDFKERLTAEPQPPELLAGPKQSGLLDIYREAERVILSEYTPPGVVVSSDLAIIQFRGRIGPFLEPMPGGASFDLLRMVHEELRLPLRQMIDEARTKQTPVRRLGLTIAQDATSRSVGLEVLPFRPTPGAPSYFIVLFRELKGSPAGLAAGDMPASEVPQETMESQLKKELASARQYLQATIEQLEANNEELKAANEEIVSSNEELRSTNEELQIAKEELQATNQELITVNDEMTGRNVEANRLNDDLTNVLNSVGIPIVVLGRDSHIRAFAPAAAKEFHLLASDIGRPISDIKPAVPALELNQMIAGVHASLRPVTGTVQDDEGRWYQLTASPYMTADNRIDGTVITAFDIDAVKKGAQLLSEAQKYSEGIIDTIRECLLVLDGELRLRSANRAFRQMFGVTPAEIEGKQLGELGRGEWDIPELRERLKLLGEADKIEDYRIERDFHHAGRRVLVLNARRIEKTSSILIALQDVSQKERAEQALRRTESGLRQMLTTTAKAIIMADGSGRVVFANQMSAQIFGYSIDELMQLPVDALIPERLRERHAQHRTQFMADPSSRPMGSGRELVGRRKDGSEFPIQVVLSPMPGENGPLVVSFVSDITRQRESEQKLRDYQDRIQRMAFDATLTEERERRRIAADLHDRIGQSLALAQIKLTSIREAVTGTPRDGVDKAVELIAQSINDTRTLSFELSPPVLYDLGIKEALSWLIEEVEKRHGIQVELIDDGTEKPLDDATAALVFRAVRELLMNVFKHAQSASATVSLQRTSDHFEVEVADKGAGFDPNATAPSFGGGFGLFSVREQISRLGGTVQIASAPREGTRVSLRVPLKLGTPQKTVKQAKS